MKPSKDKMVEGSVQSLNISPKGIYEGVLLMAGKSLVQVNFSHEAAAYVSPQLTDGSKVSLLVEPEEKSGKGKPDHPVYRLVGIHHPGNKAADSRKSHGHVSTEGRVIRLNYALHGEVNGAVLDNGDFIHLKPHGARAVKLEEGQLLTIEGELRPSYLPHRIIEAETVNGQDLHDHKPAPRRKHG